MLTIEMAKPIELTIVKAVPLNSDSALLATRVENKGESATTTIPQKIRNPTKIKADAIENNQAQK